MRSEAARAGVAAIAASSISDNTPPARTYEHEDRNNKKIFMDFNPHIEFSILGATFGSALRELRPHVYILDLKNAELSIVDYEMKSFGSGSVKKPAPGGFTAVMSFGYGLESGFAGWATSGSLPLGRGPLVIAGAHNGDYTQIGMGFSFESESSTGKTYTILGERQVYSLDLERHITSWMFSYGYDPTWPR